MAKFQEDQCHQRKLLLMLQQCFGHIQLKELILACYRMIKCVVLLTVWIFILRETKTEEKEEKK